VLVFDLNCWNKLLNSQYKQQVLTKIEEISGIKNSIGEQKIYLRLEKNLWLDSNRAYFDLISKIRNL
jgi:hypothetical protein